MMEYSEYHLKVPTFSKSLIYLNKLNLALKISDKQPHTKVKCECEDKQENWRVSGNAAVDEYPL